MAGLDKRSRATLPLLSRDIGEIDIIIMDLAECRNCDELGYVRNQAADQASTPRSIGSNPQFIHDLQTVAPAVHHGNPSGI